MKRTLFFITLLISFILTTNTSCNKGDEPTPETIDSVKSVLPKEIIWIQNNNLQGKTTIDFQLKYDTINHRIDINTPNIDTNIPNIYDSSSLNYYYNNDGYLIKEDIRYGLDFVNITIQRKENNNIDYILYEYNISSGVSTKDTTFYSYEITGGQTKVTTKEIYDYNVTPVETFITDYVYDSENKLLSVDEVVSRDTYQSMGNLHYQYNSDRSINKISYNSEDGSTSSSATYSYNSGIDNNNGDIFCRALLGRDYYLLNLSTEMYPFTFMYGSDNYFSTSITDPYHVSEIQYLDPDFGNNELKLNYELNEKKLVSKITYLLNGETSDIVSFEY